MPLPRAAAVIHAKSEQLTGSIKDRLAFHILRQGHADGSLQPGFTVVEARSGNAGIADGGHGPRDGSPGGDPDARLDEPGA